MGPVSEVPIIYLDTNVYSALARERDLRGRLTKLVLAHPGGGIGFSDANLLELRAADRIHYDLVELLKFYPTALLKLAGVVLDEEVEAYPGHRASPLATHSLFDPTCKTEDHPLLGALRDQRVEKAASIMREHAQDVPVRHATLKSNFPPARAGKYEKRQAHDFADKLTFQWLTSSHPDFAKEIVEAGTMETSGFKSIRMHAYLVFWRYYLGRRKPNPTSDLGDQAHARFYPYCRVVIVENDAAETLRQVQGQCELLDAVEIMTLRDLRRYGEQG